MTRASDDPLERVEPALTLDPRAVATRLSALPARAMRAARLGELLRSSDPHDAAWLLDALATAGRAGGPPFSIGLLAAVDLLGAAGLDDEARAAIHAAAEAHGLSACRDLLGEVELEGDARAAAPRPLVPGGRPLTLGERKAMARSWSRDVLVKLLVDPHADVVALLLANPHLTEDDVLRIATHRRSSAAILLLVLRSAKWSLSPRVRRALVRNPRMPLPVALRLVGLLDAGELRDIAADAHLAPRLRDAVLRRLQPHM
ncbi:MAG: hypothetical protein U0168_26580 [Nannocystaceae bacterium]